MERVKVSREQKHSTSNKGKHYTDIFYTYREKEYDTMILPRQVRKYNVLKQCPSRTTSENFIHNGKKR